ncbi:MAG TPA: nucleotide exchange factor GrpE [Ktedonobacterales bacterium]|jgi:molecular chaperone GrpE|nr:nucleotide exchange factor GrpE [Ktedonobacterales bacterium]
MSEHEREHEGQEQETAEAAWSPETPPAEAEPEPDEGPVTFASGPDSPAPEEAQPAESAGATGGAEARLGELERRMAELEVQLAHEREAATDYMQRWQHAQADFSNFRRRAQQEQEQRETLVAGRVIATLLPAVDSIERAFATLPPTLRGYSWIDGIGLIHLQMLNAFAAHGVQAIETEPGQPFDPTHHQPIGEVEMADIPAGNVAVVVQRGFTAKGLLLRPALVQLARAPQPAAEPTPAADAAETADTAETTETAAEPAAAASDAAGATGSEAPQTGQ